MFDGIGAFWLGKHPGKERNLVEIRAIAAGAFKFTYKRLGSYNLNITKIHFMYNVAN